MGEGGEGAAKGHSEGKEEEDKVMNDRESFEDRRREVGETEVGEEECEREVGQDSDGEEERGRAYGLALRPREIEDFGVLDEPIMEVFGDEHVRVIHRG